MNTVNSNIKTAAMLIAMGEIAHFVETHARNPQDVKLELSVFEMTIEVDRERVAKAEKDIMSGLWTISVVDKIERAFRPAAPKLF